MKHLSDKEVVAQMKLLREKEKEVLHELLLYIGEVHERGLYRDLGFSSLYSYLRDGLGYSNGGACRRSKVALCIRQYPEVYDALVEGELTLSTACELSKGVERKDFREVLERAKGKTVEEIAQLVAPKKEVKR